MAKDKKFTCKSEAQKKAIRRSYAVQNAIKNGAVPVTIKRLPDKKDVHYHVIVDNIDDNHVIVDNIDDNHVSVGLTTDPYKGDNHPNYKLEYSPLFDGKKSYMRREGTVVPINRYYDKYKGAMTEKDYNKAKEYGEKAKKKYIEKKNRKK